MPDARLHVSHVTPLVNTFGNLYLSISLVATETSSGTNVGWTHLASAEREPKTGVGRRGPYRGPGRSPGQEVRGSWKPFSFWMPNGSSKFASFSVFCKLPKPQVFVIHLSKNWRCNTVLSSPALTYRSDWRVKLQTWPNPSPVKSHRICINLMNNLWQKWGPQSTPWRRPWVAKKANTKHRINTQ